MAQPDHPGKGQTDAGKPQEPLLLDKIYRDPLAAFLHEPKPVGEIKDECLVFLDTNVLLIPYSTSKESLNSFTKIYEILSEQERLYLADRVMQEFEKNVPDKLKEVFHNLTLGQNYNSQNIDFPLLDGIPEYVELKEAEKSLKTQLDAYRKATRATLEAIEGWGHNDPVRKIYRSVFSKAKRACISSLNPIELLKSWEFRLSQKIPPGYKDSSKEDTGIGDYLLWQAVLDTCAKANKNAIVVSSEAKPDWWHKTDGQTLYARRELIEEFRFVTGGLTVRLLSPQDFLKLFGADNIIVAEVAEEQAQTAIQLKHFKVLDSVDIEKALAKARFWILSLAKGKIRYPEYTTISVEVGNGEHEFRFSYIPSSKYGVKAIEVFRKELSFVAHSTLILVAPNSHVAHGIIQSFVGRTISDINLIVGFDSEDTFTPILYTNQAKIRNTLLDFETD